MPPFGCSSVLSNYDRFDFVASLLLVAMPFAPSSFLFPVVRPGAPSSVLAPSSNKCIASSNKCLTSSNKKLVETISVLAPSREVPLWVPFFHAPLARCKPSRAQGRAA